MNRPISRSMPLIPSASNPQAAADIVAVARAKAALVRKKSKTPLEDALAAVPERAVAFVQWARKQKVDYDGSLVLWRANRLKWSQEAQDIFAHRALTRQHIREQHDMSDIFQMSNDSINIVASLAEFASAQAEQDIYGGEPWFAANPVGKTDQKLADDIQHHIEWTFRDGRFVDAQCLGIDQAVTLGECFSKTIYAVDADEYESAIPCLHQNGKPVMDTTGNYITTEEEAAASGLKFKGKMTWGEAFSKKQTIIRQGVECIPLHYNDISFREDAPELDLRYTNVYVSVEMSVFEAMRRFNLSKTDAIRLGQVADKKLRSDTDKAHEAAVDSTTVHPFDDTPLGQEELDKMLNTRVRLVEAYIRGDAIGSGKEARMCIVFPPHSEDWIIWADYLANVSPKAELPIKCDVWEPIPHKLYGRGFFSKYAYLQTGADNFWNQMNFRNSMAANPITAIHTENMELDDDTADVRIGPGTVIKPKGQKTLKDCIEFGEIPQLDQQSMELFQIGMQLAQARAGITNASQGDSSSAPESNTATGVRALLSRGAVLLKKPIRHLRRSKGRGFSYAVKLHYANFDRDEAFVWGEGENKELVTITPDHIKDLDIDVVMLLTQEQNQTKLQGAQVMLSMITGYAALSPLYQAGAKGGIVQALKALEFQNAEDMVPDPIVSFQSCIPLLPPEQQQLAMQFLAMVQQQQAATPVAAQTSTNPPQTANTTPPAP